MVNAYDDPLHCVHADGNFLKTFIFAINWWLRQQELKTSINFVRF